jgi:hypothetical protein
MCNSNDQVKEDEMCRSCSTHGERRDAYRVLAGKEETLGKPRHGWEDNTKIDLREIGWRGMEWIILAWDRALVEMLVNVQVP